MEIFNNKKINVKDRGFLLLELLVVISLLATVLFVVANGVFLSTKSNKISGEREMANTLASESQEAIRAITEENWQNIYGLVKATAHYKTIQSNGKWILSAGDESITLNNIIYTRYITIDNVSRDITNRNIESTYSLTDDDPSTQKFTINVSWAGADPVITNGYLFRWKNKICTQTIWATQTTPTDNSFSCSTSNYFSNDASIDTSTAGTLKLTGTTISGVLTSSVLDSGITGGAGYNSIMWLGALGATGGKVRFQVAASSNSTGPWSYYGGSDCGSLNWFDPINPSTPIELKSASCFAAFNNKRYFRYKVQICSSDCVNAGTNTPTVNGIVVSFTP